METDVVVVDSTETDVTVVEADTCYRSGSRWYVDLVCDKNGTWLPKRNWAPLVFFLIVYLITFFLIAIDDSLSFRARALDMMRSLIVFLVLGSIITMLILKNHTGWAWFVALLPFIMFFFLLIIGIFTFAFDGCPHCTGACSRNSY